MSATKQHTIRDSRRASRHSSILRTFLNKNKDAKSTELTTESSFEVEIKNCRLENPIHAQKKFFKEDFSAKECSKALIKPFQAKAKSNQTVSEVSPISNLAANETFVQQAEDLKSVIALLADDQAQFDHAMLILKSFSQ